MNTAAQAGSSSRTTRSERRRELDVMGTLVVVGLVFFHTAEIFAEPDFYVVNEQQNMLATMVGLVVISFASLWGMPLMMLIAGMTIWYSLRRRTVREFVRERIGRLLIPFLTGILIVFPPEVYYWLMRSPAYQESYLQFYRRFWHVEFSLSAFPVFLRGVPPDDLFRVSYLWFLIYLFVYALLLLPLVRYLGRPAGQSLIGRLTTFFCRPWALYLLAVPIALVEAAFTTETPGWWNRFVWIFFIVYGYLFASDGRFGRALQRHRRSALVLGIVAFLIYFGGQGYIRLVAKLDPFSGRSLVSTLDRFVKGFTSWFWVVYIMGTATHLSQRGGRRKRKEEPAGEAQARTVDTPRQPPPRDRIAAYAREAQLPFYVLHQTPIVVIGFYVVQWNTNALVKYLVIVLGALVATLLLYDIGVRRTRVTRFLFGMRPKREV